MWVSNRKAQIDLVLFVFAQLMLLSFIVASAFLFLQKFDDTTRGEKVLISAFTGSALGVSNHVSGDLDLDLSQRISSKSYTVMVTDGIVQTYDERAFRNPPRNNRVLYPLLFSGQEISSGISSVRLRPKELVGDGDSGADIMFAENFEEEGEDSNDDSAQQFSKDEELTPVSLHICKRGGRVTLGGCF